MLITLATPSHFHPQSLQNNVQLSIVRLNIKNYEADYEKSENDIKALQSVGQIIGEVTRQLDEERCKQAIRETKIGSDLTLFHHLQSLSKHHQVLVMSLAAELQSTATSSSQALEFRST